VVSERSLVAAARLYTRWMNETFLARLEGGARQGEVDGRPAADLGLLPALQPAFSITRREAVFGASALPSTCSRPSSSKP